jgi:FkbM family methyltransferase
LLNLSLLKRMTAATRTLQMTPPNALRFLWTYYGSRVPGAAARSGREHEIAFPFRGKQLRVRLRANGYDLDILDEIYARGAYDLGFGKPQRILDLGGNIGLATLFFGVTCPGAELACVEPVPANVALIRRNLEQNGIRATIFEAAAGPADGTVEFMVSDDPRESSAAVNAGGQSDKRQSRIVEMISVPTLLGKLGWDRIDLLKIDVEGAERELFAGEPTWLKKVEAIVGEGHHGYEATPYTIASLTAALRPCGFDVKLLEQRKGAFVFVARRA